MMRTGAANAISVSLDLLVDESVGIVSSLRDLPVLAGAPEFSRAEARLCDTGAFTGVPNAVTVDAAGIDADEARLEAIGVGLSRYAAAFHDRAALALGAPAQARFPHIRPADFALFTEAQYQRTGFPFVPLTDETPLRWTPLIELNTGETVYGPAAMVFLPYAWPRRGGDPPVVPPNEIGIAHGDGVAAAATLALADVVRRDAEALFWYARTTPPRIRLAGLPAPLAALVGRFRGRALALLDITTDNRLTTFLAVLSSENPAEPARVLGSATDLDPAAAVARAFRRLAQADALVRQARHDRAPVGPEEDWFDIVDREDHVLFAADHANSDAFAFLAGRDDERDFRSYENLATGNAGTDLDRYVERIASTGHRAFAAALTPPDVEGLGIHVCRALVPGYQPIFHGHMVRALGGDRLYEIPRRLGHRGIARGGANPLPHPFL